MNYEVIFEVERGCGQRQEGGIYLTGGRNRSEDGVLDPFTELDPPIAYPTVFHRGPRLVDCHAVLMRSPLSMWWVGSSAETEVKKVGSVLPEQLFGMSFEKRTQIGVCKDTPNEYSAIQALTNAIDPSTYQVNAALLEMTRNDINEIHQVAADFDLLVTMAQQKENYLGGVAACWRMFHNAPPSKKAVVKKCCAKMLVALGLLKDAIAMNKEE